MYRWYEGHEGSIHECHWGRVKAVKEVWQLLNMARDV